MPPTPPFVSQELIDWLKVTYPDRLPKAYVPDTELAQMIGRQEVIRKLEGMLRAQDHP